MKSSRAKQLRCQMTNDALLLHPVSRFLNSKRTMSSSTCSPSPSPVLSDPHFRRGKVPGYLRITPRASTRFLFASVFAFSAIAGLISDLRTVVHTSCAAARCSMTQSLHTYCNVLSSPNTQFVVCLANKARYGRGPTGSLARERGGLALSSRAVSTDRGPKKPPMEGETHG